MTTDAKFWDGAAQKYAAKKVGDQTAFARKKAITRGLLRPDATALELGCGTGSLALEMAAFAGHITALDISEAMTRIARDKQEAQGVHNVAFRVGTLDGANPFPPAHFDCAWAYSILHLVPDRPRTLAHLFAALKPGGAFVSSNVCLADSWIPFLPAIAVMRWLGKAPHVYAYDRATIMRELRDAGFVDVEEKSVGGGGIVAFLVAKKP